MNHCLSMLFAFILSFGHNSTAHHSDAFVKQPEYGDSSFDLPVYNRDSLARRSAFNSYSEDACLSCRMTSSALQPQLILRAQR